MTLMRNPNTTAYLCWFDDCETIEDAWQCETISAARAAEEYVEHTGVPWAFVRVGDAEHSDLYMVNENGVARLIHTGPEE